MGRSTLVVKQLIIEKTLHSSITQQGRYP